MKRYLFPVMLMVSLVSCTALNDLIQKPTYLETLNAVREVMNSSAFRAIQTFSRMSSDQGVLALLPEEFRPVIETLKTLGLGKEIDKITTKSAEIAALVASESGAIMEDAIRDVKIEDAVAIVVGGQDAATQILREKMQGAVKRRYSARLDAELERAQVNQYWGMATGAYNLFAKKKIEGSMSDFIADQAVNGLFLAMGQEEQEIRRDPASLGVAVVTKVFNYYQNQGSTNTQNQDWQREWRRNSN